MLHETIFVIGAGLRWSDGPGSSVIVDRESAAVCSCAAALAKEHSKADLCITAGKSSKFGVNMNQVLADCIHSHGIPTTRMRLPTASTFNTRGEVASFPTLKDLDHYKEDVHHIYLVVRDFHLGRTLMLLEAHLFPWERKQTRIIPVPVVSHERLQNFFMEPIKRGHDLLRTVPERVARFLLTSNCLECGGQKSVRPVWEDAPGYHRNELVCERCGWRDKLS